MSVLSFPRVHFFGEAVANVQTQNNQALIISADVETMKVVTPPSVNTLEDFRAWLMGVVKITQEPFEGEHLRAYWNPYGDNGFSWERTRVQSVQTSPDALCTDAVGDPLVGATVLIDGHHFYDRRSKAKMVDGDPTSVYTTQIISGRIALGPGASTNQDDFYLYCENPTPAFLRWIYFPRNVEPSVGKGSPSTAGSAIFQCGLPSEQLRFNEEVLKRSPTLQALKAAASAGRGLLVRYCLYFFRHEYEGVELLKHIEEAKKSHTDPRNPATGKVIGTIGPWEGDELATAPSGRCLYPSNPRTDSPSRASESVVGDHVPHAAMETTLFRTEEVGAPSGPGPATLASNEAAELPVKLGPALARLHPEQALLSLDFITAIPEDGAGLEKKNLGDLLLRVSMQDGSHYDVEVLPFERYNRSAYVLTGGTVDVRFPPERRSDMERGTLQLLQKKAPNKAPLLEEVAFPIVESDDRVIYLQSGKYAQPLKVKLRVSQKGQPVSQSIKIGISQFFSSIVPPDSTEHMKQEKVPTRQVIKLRPGIDAQRVDAPQSVTTNGCSADFEVKGLAPGLAYLQLEPEGWDRPLDNEFNPNFFYIFIRVLPEDDYSHIPDPVPWEVVLREFSAYYYINYPVMDQWVNFTDEQAMLNMASMLKTFMDPNLFNSTLYMPVTRELSEGKRRLLFRWIERRIEPKQIESM